MKHRFLFAALLGAAVSCGFSSCSDDDNDKLSNDYSTPLTREQGLEVMRSGFSFFGENLKTEDYYPLNNCIKYMQERIQSVEKQDSSLNLTNQMVLKIYEAMQGKDTDFLKQVMWTCHLMEGVYSYNTETKKLEKKAGATDTLRLEFTAADAKNLYVQIQWMNPNAGIPKLLEVTVENDEMVLSAQIENDMESIEKQVNGGKNSPADSLAADRPEERDTTGTGGATPPAFEDNTGDNGIYVKFTGNYRNKKNQAHYSCLSDIRIFETCHNVTAYFLKGGIPFMYLYVTSEGENFVSSFTDAAQEAKVDFTEIVVYMGDLGISIRYKGNSFLNDSTSIATAESFDMDYLKKYVQETNENMKIKFLQCGDISINSICSVERALNEKATTYQDAIYHVVRWNDGTVEKAEQIMGQDWADKMKSIMQFLENYVYSTQKQISEEKSRIPRF